MHKLFTMHNNCHQVAILLAPRLISHVTQDTQMQQVPKLPVGAQMVGVHQGHIALKELIII